MENGLNLVEILKDCPKGTKLYSPIFGEVAFSGIVSDEDYPVDVIAINNVSRTFTSNGRYYKYGGECMLFPSKDQRDWSKFVLPKPDLPESTIVMCSDYTDIVDWGMRKYCRNGKVYNRWDKEGICDWKYIIPFDKFDPNNIKDCIKKYNYGTEQK